MRACATVNAVCLGLAAAAFGFAACAGGSTPPEAAPPSTVGAAAQASASAATSAPAPEAAKQKPPPSTPADCRELVSEITNDPPKGVPLNNAMTEKDAGSGGRLEPLTDLIKSRRDGFRCCFDLYAKSHPGAAGAMKIVIELKPNGEVKAVSFADTQNRVNAPEVESCMSDLAKSLAYPKSPSGKETKFTYPFDFKARR